MKLTVFAVLSLALIEAGCEQQAAQVEKPPVPPKVAKEPAPKISFEKTVHDFGEIDPGTKNKGEFKFTNTGNAPLKINKIKSTCRCTASSLARKNYRPGESGTIKVTYSASTKPGQDTKYLYVPSNDPENPNVKLAVKAKIILKVKTKPKRLNLYLRKENAGCPNITITSIDGKPFSITKFDSPGACITADFNAQEKTTEFVLEPKVDIEKLRKRLNGTIRIQITHPSIKHLNIPYTTPPDFQTQPRTILVQRVEPGQRTERKIRIKSNYNEEFEIESVSSQKGSMKLLSQKKLTGQFELNIEIDPPKLTGKLKFFRDVLKIKIKDGPTIKTNCSILYVKKPKK